MCVIIVKPASVKMPSQEFLQAASDANPDGCGFCTPSANYKGMSFPGFLYRLGAARPGEPCLMHFRIATHGSIRKANCHPFYDRETGTWFMHNGILGISPVGDLTDSETAFRNIIVPNIKCYGFDSKQLDEAVQSIIGTSKFALLHGSQVKLYGKFYDYNGLYLSNTHFLPFYNRYAGYGGYGGPDDSLRLVREGDGLFVHDPARPHNVVKRELEAAFR